MCASVCASVCASAGDRDGECRIDWIIELIAVGSIPGLMPLAYTV